MRKMSFIAILLWLCAPAGAQIRDLHSSLGLEGLFSTTKYVPFWLRSDQFGSLPLPGPSGSLVGAITKEYNDSVSHMVDWGASFEGRLNVGQITQGTIIEAYGKLRVSIFELMGGRKKEIMGLVDSSLSSGAFAISGNALGIPKIQLSIPEYYRIPILGNFFSLKGNFALGWIGETPIQSSLYLSQVQTYFHQLSLYGRFGKPGWKLNLFAGFNHQVFFGNEKSIFGNDYQLSDWKTFEYVVFGKTYRGSKIGNHLGSIDLAAQYDFKKIRVFLYRQNFYDEGALFHLANLRDGLNGLSIIHTQIPGKGFTWHRLLFEVFYSKDQAGYPWSKPTPSGDENYYNNYEYAQGWSYKGLGLGNPFITPASSTKPGFPNDPTDYFNNNRVLALYFGGEAGVNSWWFKCKFSYSWNDGTFGTSVWGYSTGPMRIPPQYGVFEETTEFSGYLEVKKELGQGFDAGCVAGLDYGGLFYNSAGIILKLTKSF
jgi:hypothetical protein